MAAKGRPVSAGRSSKVAGKLQEKIREGNYYEALQTYRALYQRYSAQGREKDARDLLYDGASLLLRHNQWESGTDLALLLVKHMKEHRTPITEDVLDKIAHLFSLYRSTTPCPSSPSSSLPADSSSKDSMMNPRELFMRAALKWSSMVGGEECQFGHPHLHRLVAATYWQEKFYAMSRDHFIYSGQPEKYGTMLVEFAASKGYAGEAELFVTQAVLQLLVLKNQPCAVGVFNAYTTIHPAFREECPPFQEAPLLNFLRFLLLSVDKGDSEVFHCLRRQYASAIARDPSYNEYLDKIGKAYFGMPDQPKAGNLLDLLGGGPGGGLLGSLLGAPPPDFLEMAPPPPPPPSQTNAAVIDSRTLLSPVDIVD